MELQFLVGNYQCSLTFNIYIHSTFCTCDTGCRFCFHMVCLRVFPSNDFTADEAFRRLHNASGLHSYPVYVVFYVIHFFSAYWMFYEYLVFNHFTCTSTNLIFVGDMMQHQKMCRFYLWCYLVQQLIEAYIRWDGCCFWLLINKKMIFCCKYAVLISSYLSN